MLGVTALPDTSATAAVLSLISAVCRPGSASQLRDAVDAAND